MGLGKAIFDKLSSDLAVTAFVSTRIYPQLSPNQKDYPVVVYDIQDTEPTINASGNTSSTESKVDILIVATTYDSALVIADTVKTSLDNQKRNLGWG